MPSTDSRTPSGAVRRTISQNVFFFFSVAPFRCESRHGQATLVPSSDPFRWSGVERTLSESSPFVDQSRTTSLTKLVRVWCTISYDFGDQSRTSLVCNFVRVWSMKPQRLINKGIRNARRKGRKRPTKGEEKIGGREGKRMRMLLNLHNIIIFAAN